MKECFDPTPVNKLASTKSLAASELDITNSVTNPRYYGMTWHDFG